MNPILEVKHLTMDFGGLRALDSLDLDIIDNIRINKSAVERRAGTLGKRRSVKKEWQAAWLLML